MSDYPRELEDALRKGRRHKTVLEAQHFLCHVCLGVIHDSVLEEFVLSVLVIIIWSMRCINQSLSEYDVRQEFEFSDKTNEEDC